MRSARHRGWAALIALLAIWLQVPSVALSHTGDTYTVQMTGEGFAPDQLEIIAGDMVVFENAGATDHWPASNQHPTHQLYADFDAKRPIPPGQSWAFVFFRAGVWGYHDHLNPQREAQIIVLPDTHAPLSGESSAGGPSQTGSVGILQAFERYFNAVLAAVRQLAADLFGSSVADRAPQPTAIAAQPTLDTTFRPPPPADFEQVYGELQSDCPGQEFECWVDFVRGQTAAYGPQLAVDLVLKLKADGRIAPSVDEHQLAHQIGRQAAESFGVNDQAFLLCPMSDLNGGCQHGFFEYVLGRTETSSAAADLICQSLQEGYSAKDFFYCYHGVGHGVMMASAYDLDRALEVCDSFDTIVAQDGCWQGVFMENVNAGMGGFSREGVFSEGDPLAPCNRVAERHKHECYVNHAGWLMDYFDNDIQAATTACLQADEGYVGSCLESIGLMVTNPVWQAPLFGEFSQASFVEIAWELCSQFPAGHVDSCVIGGIDNIHNFDVFDLSRAQAFCDIVESQYRTTCYYRMGFNLFNQAVDTEEVTAICESLDPAYQAACLEGAGFES